MSYKIIIEVKTAIAMSPREEEEIRDYLDDKGYESIRITQKEVNP